MIAPENREIDDWDAVIEGVGRLVAWARAGAGD
jgi:hypothetical protein